MNKAVFPGSFDPITNGHIDIIERASIIFDELIVAVLINPKKNYLFSPEERMDLIKKTTTNIKNIKILSTSALLVDFMKENDVKIIIKGLRAVTDFDYEFQMALMNKKLKPDTETLFMTTRVENSFLSSSSVKQVAMFGGKLDGLVPNEIEDIIINKMKNK
jgi:pantetheine-phosphate adenylyltransferase